jgi:hypothetical protein
MAKSNVTTKVRFIWFLNAESIVTNHAKVGEKATTASGRAIS